MTAHRLLVLLAGLEAAGCGSGVTSTPISPTSTSVAGTWTQVGGTRTWDLTQSGITAGGKSSFTIDRSHFGGTVSANGGGIGSVLFGVFNFSDLADGLPGLPVTMDCSVEIDGSLVVNGNTMKGTYTELDDCNGVRLATFRGTLTMQKQ